MSNFYRSTIVSHVALYLCTGIIGFAFMVPSAFAATEAELQKQIDTLREQIAAVQKLTATPAVLGVTTSNPSVVLSYPNKGEKFAIGEKMTVAWEAKNIPVNSTCLLYTSPSPRDCS